MSVCACKEKYLVSFAIRSHGMHIMFIYQEENVDGEELAYENGQQQNGAEDALEWLDQFELAEKEKLCISEGE